VVPQRRSDELRREVPASQVRVETRHRRGLGFGVAGNGTAHPSFDVRADAWAWD
jgi:hypothetical protein